MVLSGWGWIWWVELGWDVWCKFWKGGVGVKWVDLGWGEWCEFLWGGVWG